MTIKEFIDKAIEGGWMYQGEHTYTTYPDIEAPLVAKFTMDGIDFGITKEQVFLEPKAWEAVGKVEGWNCKDWKYRTDKEREAGLPDYERDTWTNKMNGLTPALIEGKTIEEYIATL